jgi:hypothetical protein
VAYNAIGINTVLSNNNTLFLDRHETTCEPVIL